MVKWKLEDKGGVHSAKGKVVSSLIAIRHFTAL